MNLITFDDTCTVTRSLGPSGAWDEEQFEDVYSGEARYSISNNYYAGEIIASSPTVYIPETDTGIATGDLIEVYQGETLVCNGQVSDVRVCSLNWIDITRITVKRNVG